jgi:hypothetical protein
MAYKKIRQINTNVDDNLGHLKKKKIRMPNIKSPWTQNKSTIDSGGGWSNNHI